MNNFINIINTIIDVIYYGYKVIPDPEYTLPIGFILLNFIGDIIQFFNNN